MSLPDDMDENPAIPADNPQPGTNTGVGGESAPKKKRKYTKETKPRRPKNSHVVAIDYYGQNLTEGQIRFVREWIADGNALNAYMRAFPEASLEVARANSSRMLQKPEVKEFRKLLFRHRADNMGLKAARVLAEQCRIAFADVGDVFDHAPDGSMRLRKWADVNPDCRKAISKIKVTQRQEPGSDAVIQTVDIQFHSKPEALKALSQYLGIGTDGNDAIRELAAAIAGRTAVEESQKPATQAGAGVDHGGGEAD